MHEITDWIDTQSERLLELVQTWAHINSGTHNLTGNKRMQQRLLCDFNELKGTRYNLITPPAITWNNHGDAVKQHYSSPLLIRKRMLAPVRVLLGGHMDTVFPANSMFQSTHWRGHQQLYGPGVADMKGGLAIMLIALMALERSPYAEKIGWDVLITADEEVGSPTSYPLWRQYAWQNNYALLFEPALPDGAIVDARKGSSNYTLICRGRSAHVGRDFKNGINAIAALAEVIVAIQRLNRQDDGLVINVGTLHGGSASNVVPDYADCLVSLRADRHATLIHGERCLQAIINQVQSTTGASFSLHLRNRRPPKIFDCATQHLMQLTALCAAELDISLAHRAVGGVCDGNYIAAEGIPTLDSLGAIGDNLHTHEEWIWVPSLVERAKLAALLLVKLALQGSADRRRPNKKRNSKEQQDSSCQ
jgi:glutamate carboxypeptidase